MKSQIRYLSNLSDTFVIVQKTVWVQLATVANTMKSKILSFNETLY